jgi:hypothetical protein
VKENRINDRVTLRPKDMLRRVFNLALAPLVMRDAILILIGLLASCPALASQKPMPLLHDGIVVDDPGTFFHDGELRIEGHVTLRHLSLDLRGPIIVEPEATLELDGVRITVSDPPGTPNGTSGLNCKGPAHIVVRSSTMEAVGAAHPMWHLRGDIRVDGFQTANSEFHLSHTHAVLNRLKIFELEISYGSQVAARHLNLTFLSTHTGENDRISFSDIPADEAFSRKLRLGSDSTADLQDVRAQFFLLYVHGTSTVLLHNVARAQLAIFPACSGTFSLPRGRLGRAGTPYVVPEAGHSDCPFRITLDDVNVDTWDVYAGGDANLILQDSVIDELNANGRANLVIRDSDLYGDWMAVADHAQVRVESSTVGALRLARERADLATSQIRLSGQSQSVFFVCVLIAESLRPIPRPPN